MQTSKFAPNRLHPRFTITSSAQETAQLSILTAPLSHLLGVNSLSPDRDWFETLTRSAFPAWERGAGGLSRICF